MASAGEIVVPANMINYARTPNGRRIVGMVMAAALVAVIAGFWMWDSQPEYRVLFSQFSDRDGGAIVAELEKMGIPYKFAEGGGAVLVPANRVHDARLKLAAQGLPKGGNVGFELMETQRLGASQFVERINFQRAMEGELARSIESMSAVRAARVHLAMPRESVFVTEQKAPSASVLLNLHPGRTLDAQQVSAIVHLVASSIPELSPKNVTVVDQNGALLSESGKPASAGLDPTQMQYVQSLQQDVVRRIESILTPIVGKGNVRAEATAEVDFSRSEQAVETYRPNQTPDAMAIRSQQTSESANGGNTTGGVPGALTNQPPAPATAPVEGGAAQAVAAGQAGSTRRDSTVNYEVDKTIQYVQQTGGALKRLSVAVVVNHRTTVNPDGKTVTQPLSAAEMTQINNLVREAMGFSAERGDTLNVVNSAFARTPTETLPEPPLWEQPGMIALAKEIGRYTLMGIVLLFLYLKVLKPLLAKPQTVPASDPQLPAAAVGTLAVEGTAPAGAAALAAPQSAYQDHLARAQQLAKEDPRVVANIVKTWVNGNE